MSPKPRPWAAHLRPSDECHHFIDRIDLIGGKPRDKRNITLYDLLQYVLEERHDIGLFDREGMQSASEIICKRMDPSKMVAGPPSLHYVVDREQREIDALCKQEVFAE